MADRNEVQSLPRAAGTYARAYPAFSGPRQKQNQLLDRAYVGAHRPSSRTARQALSGTAVK